MADHEPMTNVDPERVAEALAVYTDDRRAVNAANGRTKKHQNYYEDEHGVDAKAIRERYRESQMTAAERQRKYATEQVTRRAVGLWDAETPEEFDELMTRAASVEAASGEGADKLRAARAYNDGFNSGLKGGLSISDNPQAVGTLEHQQWAIGCADGVDQKAGDERTPMSVQAAPEPPAKPRAARKKAAAPSSLFGEPEEMPEPAGMPE